MKDYNLSLQSLHDKGLRFHVNYLNEWGHQLLNLSVEDALSYINDPLEFLASLHGVKRSEYLDWCDQEFSVVCCAETRHRKRCKKIITGGQRVSAKTWVAMQGSYCPVHGGE